MTRAVWGVVLCLLAACNEKSRSTDTRSSTVPTAKQRVAFLCAYALCPSPAKDAAFQVVFHDNSRGLIPGPDDAEIRAVLLVEKDELEKWSRGCVPAVVEGRPPWLSEILAGTRGFEPTSAPDGFRCGAELRAVHVRDGLVVRSISTR